MGPPGEQPLLYLPPAGNRMVAPMRARLLAAALAVLAVSAPSTADAVPAPIAVSAAGPSGSGRIEDGRSCADGGDGRYWHYEYAGGVAPGSFTQRPSELRLHLDLHHDQGEANAFLQEDASHASLLDDRGTIRVRLRSAAGSCADDPSLPFDGTTVTGAGTWEVDRGAGAYEGATGSGTFDLSAAVAPGADNPWALDLDGSIDIPGPALSVQVLRTYWASLGTDYLTRRPTVVYRITNSGPGAAYAARLVSATSSSPGVTPLGPVPQTLGDLAPGESTDVAVRYQFGLVQPCALVILSCPFTTAVGVQWTDALDRPLAPVLGGLATQAPNLPPPL